MTQRRRRWRKVRKEPDSDQEIKKQRKKRKCRGIEEGDGRGRKINRDRLKDSKREREM